MEVVPVATAGDGFSCAKCVQLRRVCVNDAGGPRSSSCDYCRKKRERCRLPRADGTFAPEDIPQEKKVKMEGKQVGLWLCQWY